MLRTTDDPGSTAVCCELLLIQVVQLYVAYHGVGRPNIAVSCSRCRPSLSTFYLLCYIARKQNRGKTDRSHYRAEHY